MTWKQKHTVPRPAHANERISIPTQGIVGDHPPADPDTAGL